MRVIYTDALTVSDTEIAIKRGDGGAGTGEIPMSIQIMGAVLFPTTTDAVWQIKGTHTSSTWVSVTGPFDIDPVGMTESVLCYVKATSEITLNLAVKGE